VSFFRRAAGPRPNIVMILLDQFRNDARSVHPVFATLGARGCVFPNTITYAPYTLASMHATFTGLYGRQNGVDAYTKSDRFDARHCRTLTQYLQAAGYHTRGYTFSSILLPPTGWDQLRIVTEDDEPGILESHVAELREAFGQKRPFFSYLHYGEIHHVVVKNVLRKYDPWAPEYFDHRDTNRERYRDYARGAADYLASLVKTIDELDERRNTMLVVMADHGGGVGEKPGEKAYGVFTYDYSIKTWMYQVAPGLLPDGREFATQVRTVDLLPTLLDLLAIVPSKKHKPLAGRSLLPVIAGEETDHRLAFTETGGVEGPHPSPDAPNVKAVRDGRWKLIYSTSTNSFELYDLETDPDELRNLYPTEPDKARELWMKMVDHL
jgi:arylsulfatase A-like enzyme